MFAETIIPNAAGNALGQAARNTVTLVTEGTLPPMQIDNPAGENGLKTTGDMLKRIHDIMQSDDFSALPRSK